MTARYFVLCSHILSDISPLPLLTAHLFSPFNIGMNHTKLQIDAQRALRSRAPDRSKRAVFASKDALHYRYEGQQFSDVNFPTFIDLFVALPGPQLSTVAKIPEVIQPRSSPRAIFEDGWLRLYRDGWDTDPVLAALVLIGLSTQLIFNYAIILTKVEAAHWVLKSALNALELPPLEVIKACDEHVTWVKEALCKPRSAATQPSPTTRSSHNTHRDQRRPEKRPLSEMDSPSDVENPETLTPVQERHDASVTCGGFVDGPCSQEYGYIDKPLSTIDAVIQANSSNLDTLVTSRTLEPNINPAVLQPIETEVSDTITDTLPPHEPGQEGDIPLANQANANEKQPPRPTHGDSEINTKSIVAPSGTISTTSLVTWTEVPGASGASSILDASRTFEFWPPEL
ncbi:uncharacterized protein F5Z01DRAFT_641233 [Emericellopsis atlantica]|uniref:Uncharacterized protein n=1 Tax=Emericellopsis atlantica TaxID=2614577 RepID=A0A9P8CJJ2_9HYPO|nr:uncharacterized protein F5Z01DRAFT_641233 [Emericellopsis atlantica]KAG9249403.1 hypothetical protein F5Z01DRAFT_641233 [Emericellopsis atlantica]